MLVAEHLKAFVESSSHLMGQHLTLARLELREDARAMASQMVGIAVFAFLLVVGYGFLCVAAGHFLARFMASDVAFLLIAGAHLLVGGIGIGIAARKLQKRVPMAESLDEMVATARALKPNGNGRLHAQ